MSTKNQPPFIQSLDQLHGQLIKNYQLDDTKLEEFFSATYDRISDPYQLDGMQIAIDKIIATMKADKKICIYADYDADGVPGASVLAGVFEKLGYKKVKVFFPHRHTQGYGLHPEVLHKLYEDNVSLVITIDLGITAVAAVEYANSLGLEVIITDHHEPGEKLPSAVTVIDPKLGTYPDPMICGAAVAWQVGRALLDTLHKNQKLLPNLERPKVGWEKTLLDLVGVSTISDMVPLKNENRILAQLGLIMLRISLRPGVLALCEVGKIHQPEMDEQDVAFRMTPRINAASRMDHASRAYQVLTAKNLSEARQAATYLEALNQARKKVVVSSMRQVNRVLKTREKSSVIVIGDPDWNPGVLSILAGKIMEEHQAPTFVWTRVTKDDGTTSIKGSCRGYANINVLKMLHAVPKNVFKHCGGHKAAAGFTLPEEHIHDLPKYLEEAYKSSVTQEDLTVNDNGVTAVIAPDLITNDIIDVLKKFSPYGVKHHEPLFKLSAVSVISIRAFGKTREHVEVTFLKSDQTKLRAVAFFTDATAWDVDLTKPSLVDLEVTITQSWYKGRASLSLYIKNIAAAASQKN